MRILEHASRECGLRGRAVAQARIGGERGARRVGRRRGELMPKHRFYGWTMLAALWGVMFLNLGFPAYGPAVINAAMAKSVGLHREALGNMFMIYMIMSGLPGPLVAMSVNRFGVRKTLTLGSAFIVSGA